MKDTHKDTAIILDAATIYGIEDSKTRDFTLSVVASPFYMPKEATAFIAPSTGDLQIKFSYDTDVKTDVDTTYIGEIRVGFEIRTGRVVHISIPKEQIPKTDELHLRLDIEGVFKRTMAKIRKPDYKINQGSLIAALSSLKAYSTEFSHQASI